MQRLVCRLSVWRVNHIVTNYSHPPSHSDLYGRCVNYSCHETRDSSLPLGPGIGRAVPGVVLIYIVTSTRGPRHTMIPSDGKARCGALHQGAHAPIGQRIYSFEITNCDLKLRPPAHGALLDFSDRLCLPTRTFNASAESRSSPAVSSVALNHCLASN